MLEKGQWPLNPLYGNKNNNRNYRKTLISKGLPPDDPAASVSNHLPPAVAQVWFTVETVCKEKMDKPTPRCNPGRKAKPSNTSSKNADLKIKAVEDEKTIRNGPRVDLNQMAYEKAPPLPDSEKGVKNLRQSDSRNTKINTY